VAEKERGTRKKSSIRRNHVTFELERLTSISSHSPCARQAGPSSKAMTHGANLRAAASEAAMHPSPHLLRLWAACRAIESVSLTDTELRGCILLQAVCPLHATMIYSSPKRGRFRHNPDDYVRTPRAPCQRWAAARETKPSPPVTPHEIACHHRSYNACTRTIATPGVRPL